MIPRRLSSQRGSVVLVALCFVAVLAISTTTYLALCGRALTISARTMDADLGKQLAEAGVEAALEAFNTGDWSAWSISGTTATRTITFASTKYGNSGATGTIKLRVDNYDAFRSAETWSSSTAYKVGDVVGRSGTWYRCVQAHTNQTPNGLYNFDYWVPEGPGWQWNATTTYAAEQLVNHNGNWYRCTSSHTNQAPPNVSYWTEIPAIRRDNTSGVWNVDDALVYWYGTWYRWHPSDYWDSSPPITWRWRSGLPYAVGDILCYGDPPIWYRATSAHTSSWSTEPTDAGAPWARVDSYWNWSSATAYNVGDVAYRSGSWYRCLRTHSNQQPPNSTYWSNAPLESNDWNSTTDYSTNNVVHHRGVWYRCISAHSGQIPPNATYWTPATASAWSSATAYAIGDYVTYGGAWFRCISAHTNQAPPNATYWTAATVAWSSSTAYSSGNRVAYGGTWYRCTTANTGQSPNNSGYWDAQVAPVIYAEGRAARADGTLVREQVRATVAVAPLFPNAVAATSSVTFASGGTVDSYDTALGAYGGSNLGYAAVVAGGNTSADAVTMSGALVVNGYVAAPPAASSPHAALFTYNATSTVVKGTSATPSPKVDATRVLRNPYIPTYDIHTVNGGMALSAPSSNITLGTPGGTTPSVYTITGDVTLSTNIDIVGPVILYVTGNLAFGATSSARIRIASTGSLVLRVDGNFTVHASSEGFQNLTLNPAKCVVLLAKATTGTFSYSDTTNAFYGVLYLPDSTSSFSFVNGFTMYGAVVAQTLNFTGNATIHYDIALRTAVIDGVDAPYVIADFRELPATEFADLDF